VSLQLGTLSTSSPPSPLVPRSGWSVPAQLTNVLVAMDEVFCDLYSTSWTLILSRDISDTDTFSDHVVGLMLCVMFFSAVCVFALAADWRNEVYIEYIFFKFYMHVCFMHCYATVFCSNPKSTLYTNLHGCLDHMHKSTP